MILYEIIRRNIMGIKLSNIFKPEDSEEDIDSYEVKDTSKSTGKEYKNKTILVEPRAFSEAQQIADYLKNKNQVVVNFKRVTSDVSKRIMDFLNGIIYAIDGTMQKLGPGIVICAPKGFEIEGNITEEEGKKTSKKDDLGEW
jgi:cell division inhibitor SepF